MQSSSSSLLVLCHNAFSLSIMTLCNHRHHHFLFSDTMHSHSPLWLYAIIIIITSCSDTTHYNFKWSPTPSPLIMTSLWPSPSSWCTVTFSDTQCITTLQWPSPSSWCIMTHSLTYGASWLYCDHHHHHDALRHNSLTHDFTVTTSTVTSLVRDGAATTRPQAVLITLLQSGLVI